MIPQHARKIRPPRALAVPFELGRPLGVPGDAAFQLDVLRAALGLLVADEDAPQLMTYEVEAPSTSDDVEGWSCPVSFNLGEGDQSSLADEVRQEIGLLKPWYDKSIRDRHRTTVGVSGIPIADIPAFLVQFIDSPGSETVPEGVSAADALKWAAEDLKAFYNEAATAQPGNATSGEIANWFWNESHAGRLLRDIRVKCREHPDAQVQITAGFTLVPLAQA